MPLKSVALSVSSASGTSLPRAGEAMLTQYGMEGGLIYAVSAAVRQELKTQGVAMLYWDLLPQKSLSAVVKQLSVPIGKMTLSTCLRKRLGLSPLKISLLRELVPERLSDMSALAHAIKRLPMPVHSLRPLDEAISSAGGVCGSELTHDLMLKQCAGVFCAGEMLDWDAPTGGYLLTAVLASGLIAGRGAQRYLQQDGKG
jgi:predicted flavoprotein YhiN